MRFASPMRVPASTSKPKGRKHRARRARRSRSLSSGWDFMATLGPASSRSEVDASERQADAMGSHIARDLASVDRIEPGPVSSNLGRLAARHLGVDLTGARIQVDTQADEKARRFRALAVTEGSTINFRTVHFAPGTLAGRTLLGHELTHVAQQRQHGMAGQAPRGLGSAPRGGLFKSMVRPRSAVQAQLDPAVALESDGATALGAGRRKSDTVLFSGREAVIKALQILPNAQGTVVPDGFGGEFKLVPGMTSGDKMFVTDIGGRLVFLSGDNMISIATRDFPRSVFLDAIGRGVQSAAWLEKVGKTGFAFLVPFMGAVLGPLGLGAAIATAVIKSGFWYAGNKDKIDLASSALPDVGRALGHFIANCPELARLIGKAVALNALKAIPEGLSSEDVADLLGRLLGGAAAAPSLGFRALAVVARKALATSTALRGPGASVRGAKERAIARLMEVQEIGIGISEEEAKAIVDEGCLGSAATEERLKQLDEALKRLGPMLEGLAQSVVVVT
jgi:hypothetical protein